MQNLDNVHILKYLLRILHSFIKNQKKLSGFVGMSKTLRFENTFKQVLM